MPKTAILPGSQDAIRDARHRYGCRCPTPVHAAIMEWYDGLEEGDKATVDSMVLAIRAAVQGRGVPVGFGPAQAMELLGVIVALEMGWKRVRV